MMRYSYAAPQQVWKLEIFVPKWNLLEVLHEIGERVVVERALPDLAVEVDVFEDILKRIGVGVF